MAERLPRMVLSTEGMEGSGKTDFALSAPRPLWLLDFDFGAEGTRHAGRVDERRTYDLMAAQWQPEAEAARYAQDVMKRYIADFREALKLKVRTLVTDTMTAAWAGQRLARRDDKYVEMEAEFSSLIQAAYASPHTNVILIHHMTRDWKRTKEGKPYKGETWSRDGMDGIVNKVQLAIRQRYVQPVVVPTKPPTISEQGRFEIDVLKSRDNIGFVGTTHPGMDFVTLCTLVAPTVDWSK